MIRARCDSFEKLNDRIFPVKTVSITNAIKARVFGVAQRVSRLAVQTSWLFTYGRISLLRAWVLLVCLIILIRVVSALACRGIEGEGSSKSYARNVRQGWYVVDSPRRGPLRDEVWTLLEREC